MDKETENPTDSIDEKEFYNSTRLFSKNGLFQESVPDVVCSWDLRAAVGFSIIISLSVFFLDSVQNKIVSLLPISLPILTAVIVIFVTGITILFTFSKYDAYMRQMYRTKTHRKFLFIPYWGAAVAIAGIALGIISSIIFSNLNIEFEWVYLPIFFFNLLLLLYTVFQLANFCGTLVRHVIYRMKYLDENQKENEKCYRRCRRVPRRL